MSEEVKEIKKEVKEEAEEVKEEVKEVINKVDLGFSPFVTENDRFDIFVKCYKEKNDEIIVKNVDIGFDDERKDIKEIKFTFKHASQGDFNIISSQAGLVVNEDDKADNVSLNKLEFARLLVLIRDWNLPYELNNSNIIGLNPKIVKAVIYDLREKISLEGIL